MKTHHGSCHCGAVRYEVELQLEGRATRCNCTICTKLGVSGAITQPPRFRLLQGEEVLARYARHPDIAQRHFCSRCGVHCFSRGTLPELGGAFVGINVNTLDDVDLGEFTFAYWDGRHDNWQAGLRPTPWPLGLS
ncbi:MAG: GFA family protein [Myxococcaceae bacterium]